MSSTAIRTKAETEDGDEGKIVDRGTAAPVWGTFFKLVGMPEESGQWRRIVRAGSVLR